MSSRLPAVIFSVVVGTIFFWYAGESITQPVLEVGPDAEVTGDGLHRLDTSIMPAAWVSPDLDLSGYSRVFFMPTAIQFREVPERRYNIRTMENVTEFTVSERRQLRFRELFGESFRDSVGAVESYELSNTLGRDVLMVQGMLTDVISGVPPASAGITTGTIAWAWEASIILEVRDSMSDEILARTAIRERMDGPFDVGLVMTFTPRVMQGWARMLIGQLEELSAL
jgi:hypothetical protein